jgi:hypothetical protein
MTWRKRTAWIAVAILLALAVGLLVQFRSDSVRERIRRTLAANLNADVVIEDLSVVLLPRPRLTGAGVTLRVRNRPDLPPFISIARVWMDLGLFSLVRRHVEEVHMDGLKIQVPPKDARKTFGDNADADEDPYLPSKIIIERLTTHDAVLSFISDKPNHRPHVFQIEDLELRQLGFERAVPFRARLVNPLPQGLVEADGSFGPWVKDDPAETPVNGTYVFSDADLSTIDGIRGHLSSRGSFDGRITEIGVNGTTTTPDFNLELGGKPLPLETRFSALVDGTNGTTMLREVDATLGHSSIVAKGGVVNLPGPTGHQIDLDVSIPKGRLEDLLSLVTPAKVQPVATGSAVARATVHLPAGKESILTRLQVKGDFSLSETKFERKVQAQIREFSRRTQGKDEEEMDATVASNVKALYSLNNGTMHLRDLSFQVPGATVALDGTCNLRTRGLDLAGSLRMQASVSRAVGGFKSIFLKIVDPFFRKNGKTVIPIKIGGTIEDPRPGLRLRK